MHKRFIIIFCFLGFCSQQIMAQNKDKVLAYINQYKDLAIEEMQRTGVPAAITLAQGIHESGAGTSQLALSSNNHFGIKCKSNWTGATVYHDDDEKGECFRKYDAVLDSYKDHSDFLKNGQRYAFLFQLDPTDYKDWANGLKKAGYATNPLYAKKLIQLIEDYNLEAYTLQALQMEKPATNPLVLNEENKESKNDEKSIGIEISTPSYPEGKFKLNETPVIYAKKGTPLLSIAREYDIPLARLFDFNDMQSTIALTNDRLIFLQRKRRTGHHEFHIVQPGETLFDIAQTEAIRLSSLQELNWLQKDDMPAIGEKLFLHTKADVMPKLALKLLDTTLTQTYIH